MLNKIFLKFRYTAIRRYGEKKWSAQDGVVESGPRYAWYVDFSSGTTGNGYYKSYGIAVRAVAAF